MSIFKTKSFQLIEKAKQMYGDRYDYSNTFYINSYTKPLIKCNTCGKEFNQKLQNHFYFNGCVTCSRKTLSEKLTKPLQSVLADFKKIHGEKYNYSKVKYVDWKTPVTIICPIHGCFLQQPNVHLQGSGCTSCSHLKPTNSGVNVKYPVDSIYLYVVQFKSNQYEFIKVGITTREVKKRFSNSSYKVYNIDILFEKLLPTQQCINLESECLIHFQPNRYFISSKDTFKGCTEIFHIKVKDDILNFINTKLGLHTNESMS